MVVIRVSVSGQRSSDSINICNYYLSIKLSENCKAPLKEYMTRHINERNQFYLVYNLKKNLLSAYYVSGTVLCELYMCVLI